MPFYFKMESNLGNYPPHGYIYNDSGVVSLPIASVQSGQDLIKFFLKKNIISESEFKIIVEQIRNSGLPFNYTDFDEKVYRDYQSLMNKRDKIENKFNDIILFISEVIDEANGGIVTDPVLGSTHDLFTKQNYQGNLEEKEPNQKFVLVSSKTGHT